MRNLLRQAAVRKSRILDAHASSMVTYRRGGASVRLPATSGNPLATNDSLPDVGNITGQQRDFTLAAAALVLGGQPVTPEPRDVIVDSDGLVFEVFDRGPGCYRYSDPQNVRLRIFTRLAPPLDE